MKKIFKTEDYKKRYKLFLGCLLACFIYTLIILKFLFHTGLELYYTVFLIIIKTTSIITSFNGFLTYLFLVIFILFGITLLSFLLSFPVNIIVFAYYKSKVKNMKENLTYNEEIGIEYFRETFKDISPTEVSLIIDYKLEYNKDIAGILLRLYEKKYINFDNNKIIVLDSPNQNKLLESEEYVLNKIKNNESINEKELLDISVNEAQKMDF